MMIKMLQVLVDEDDKMRLSHHGWFLHGNYMEAKIGGKNQLMHRFIIQARKKEIVDHINGNTLDNRKSNLRITDVEGNSMNRRINKNNTSGYRGVILLPNGKYVAQIRIRGDLLNLGTFTTAEEASGHYELVRESRIKG